MIIDEVIKKIDEQFVEDYDIINNFMIDVNDILDKLLIEKYNYNEFCIDIKTNIINLINETEEISIEISTDILIVALNNVIKYKILKDDNYEDKIKKYFEDPEKVLDDINILKIKNIGKKP